MEPAKPFQPGAKDGRSQVPPDSNIIQLTTRAYAQPLTHNSEPLTALALRRDADLPCGVDEEPPLDPLSLTPEEKESAAAYLRTTFRMHPMEPEEKDKPAAAPSPIGDEAGAVKLVLLKKDQGDDLPA